MSQRQRGEQKRSEEEARRLLLEKWLEARRLIDARLEEILGQLGPDALPNVAAHIIRGGKRFRGFMTVIVAESLGARPEDAVDAAVAIELVQAASLAIDDIIDKDQTRRGRRAAWVLYGIERTVLTSLILIPVAQRIVEKLGFTALFHVIRAWEQTVRGEVMDSILTPLLTPQNYPSLIEKKTGHLFRLATLLGALSAGRRDKPTLQAAADYGLYTGLAYQLADDIADYTIHTRQGRPPDPAEKLFIEWAKTLDPQNPIGAAKKQLHQYLNRAAAAAQSLPTTTETHKKLLKYIPLFIVKKLFEEAGIDPSSLPNL